jgi:hypothetical protein
VLQLRSQSATNSAPRRRRVSFGNYPHHMRQQASANRVAVSTGGGRSYRRRWE